MRLQKAKDDIPFLWEHDFFNRRLLIERITLLLNLSKESLVLAINGDWGSGKTVFVKMFEHYLHEIEKSGYTPIYFSAWEHDFSEDPFIAFLSALSPYLTTDEEQKQFKQLKEKAVPILLAIGRCTLNKSIQVVTGVDIKAILDEINSSANKEFDPKADSALRSQWMRNYDLHLKSKEASYKDHNVLDLIWNQVESLISSNLD